MCMPREVFVLPQTPLFSCLCNSWTWITEYIICKTTLNCWPFSSPWSGCPSPYLIGLQFSFNSSPLISQTQGAWLYLQHRSTISPLYHPWMADVAFKNTTPYHWTLAHPRPSLLITTAACPLQEISWETGSALPLLKICTWLSLSWGPKAKFLQWSQSCSPTICSLNSGIFSHYPVFPDPVGFLLFLEHPWLNVINVMFTFPAV